MNTKGRVLVTGGAGFIGSHTTKKLLRLGYDVIVLDDLSTGVLSNLNVDITSDLHNTPPIIIIGSINDMKLLEYLFGECGHIDYVIHLGAKLSVPESMVNPELYQKVNVQGTYNLIQCAQKYGVKKMVLASTCAADGDSYYGLSKKITEDMAGWFTKCNGLNTTCLRYVNVYGPRQAAVGEGAVVPAFINILKEGASPIIHGDGKQSRDFVYVKDVADANIYAMLSDFVGISYVATGVETSIIDLLSIIQGLLGVKMPSIIYKERRDGDMMTVGSHYPEDEFGWIPKVSLREGLSEMINKK